MKAALWYAKEDIRVEDVQEPKAEKDLVKIKVKWCGICGSDLHEYTAGPIFIPVEKPHPLSKNKAPIILGHEFSGEVVEVGENVTRFNVGDRVVAEPIVACGKCPACQEGKYNLCEHLGFHGLCGSGGGFAEYTVLPENFVHKIPDTLSYEKAALVEPVAVALHSLRQANFEIGQTALVLGAGPIGLSTVECLKAAGAKTIIVMQRASVKQEYAKRAGADYVIDPNEVDVGKEARRLTDGIGVDVAFDTTGAKVGLMAALEGTKYNGTIVITSIWEQDVSFNLNPLVFAEKKMVGTIGYRHIFPSTVKLMADGRIKADGWITKKVALDDIQDGFDTLTGPERKKHIKVLVTPDKDLL